ncbi:hypothetical protein T02_734 [Trichinella nativa]|uniref:Uncharacterized protein n=1 Tax=Trichinella nativa TaxID=6335 RepID=A0A0V1KK30_9BILA|nr:hypothetical protein T02_734 [Trichinella nativa]
MAISPPLGRWEYLRLYLTIIEPDVGRLVATHQA